MKTIFRCWIPAFAGMTILLLASCAEMPKQSETKPAAAPVVTEDTLRKRAQDQLAQGITQYQAGDFDNAVRSLSASLDHGLLTKEEQSRARKFLAFSHCVSQRDVPCRDEFRKAFEINPQFSLTAAEDGHPIWGPVYRDVRAKLIAEREASQGKPKASLAKAEQLLVDGIVKYDSGDYPGSYKLLESALKEGLKEKSDQVRAMKHMAFNLCLQEKWRDCRAAFIKIYDVDPAFDLTPAEAGHPSWTRTFAGAKAQAKRALAEKEKGKAPTAPATVPKKN